MHCPKCNKEVKGKVIVFDTLIECEICGIPLIKSDGN